MGDAPDFNDLVRDDPAAAWRACGRAKAHRPESGNGTGNLPLLDFHVMARQADTAAPMARRPVAAVEARHEPLR
jgi:hypothetical protein